MTVRRAFTCFKQSQHEKNFTWSRYSGCVAVGFSQNRESAIEWPSYSTIISEQPEGENITDVIGKNFAYTYEQNQMMRQQTYNGVASYVKGTDGNIYIYNPVPGYRAGSYLKLEPTSDGRYVAHTPQAIDYERIMERQYTSCVSSQRGERQCEMGAGRA